mgnify:CR=1 FL=1
MLTVSFDIDGNAAPAPSGLAFDVEWFSAAALGGPERAEIRVSGAEDALWALAGWLRRGVTIRNGYGSVVWHGFVNEVRVTAGRRTVGVSLAELHNRIKVRYTTLDAEGASIYSETEWLEDSQSVFAYGTHEWKPSAGSDLTDAEALRQQQQMLEFYSQPLPVLSDGSGEAGALLLCSGWWSALDWVYFENLSGRVEHDVSGDWQQAIGWRLTSTEIGFWQKRLFHIDAQLGALREGEQFVISGSGANNGTRTVAGAASQEAVSVTATTISFVSSDDIFDSAGGMGALRSPEMIRVSGDGANDGFHLLEQASATALNTDTSLGGGLATYGAGPSITIEQGHSIETVESGTTEAPGATVTVAHYDQVAQAWQTAESWPLGKVAIRCMRVGTPAQPLVVEIRSNSSGAPSGTVLASASVAAADVPTAMNWTWVQFDRSWAPAAATIYWVVVRTAGLSATDYFLVELDSESLAAEGPARLWTGAAWVGVAPAAASLPCKVWGEVDASLVLADVLAASPLLVTVDVPAAMGVWLNPYAAGEQTALSVAKRLMGLGTATGERLAAAVGPERGVSVRALLAAGETDWRWGVDGLLRLASGGPIEEGLLPAGRFVWVDGVPQAWGLERLRTGFVERAQYDVASERVALTFAEALDPLRAQRVELG